MKNSGQLEMNDSQKLPEKQSYMLLYSQYLQGDEW